MTELVEQLSERVRSLESSENPVVFNNVISNVSNPPTQGEINTAFGATAAQLRDGWSGVIYDSVDVLAWQCTSIADSWWVTNISTGGGVIGSGATNQITYWSASNTIAGRASLTDDGTTVYINRSSATALHIEQSGVNDDVFVVDTANGRIGINVVPTAPIHLAGTAGVVDTQFECFSATAGHEARFVFRKSHTNTLGSLVTTVDAEDLGLITASGVDTSNATRAACQIFFEQDGAAGAAYVPGRVIIRTSNASGSNVERVRIDKDGLIGVNTLATPGARLHIISAGGAEIGQIIEAGAAQTGNLLEINTAGGSGGDRLHVKADGELYTARAGGGIVTIARDDTIVISGNRIGEVIFHSNDADATSSSIAARIRAVADGDQVAVYPKVNMGFYTSNAAIATLRMVIESFGDVNILNDLKIGGSAGDNPASALEFADAKDITLGTTTGTKIGTATSQKIGFFNATPVVQRPKASYNNWAAFTDVVDALVDLGLFDAA